MDKPMTVEYAMRVFNRARVQLDAAHGIESMNLAIEVGEAATSLAQHLQAQAAEVEELRENYGLAVDSLAQLQSQLEAAEGDARRYRWLRDESGDLDKPFIAGPQGKPFAGEGWLCGELADAAIDALLNPATVNAEGESNG